MTFLLFNLQDNKGSIFKSPTILTTKGGTFYALVILKGLSLLAISHFQRATVSELSNGGFFI